MAAPFTPSIWKICKPEYRRLFHSNIKERLSNLASFFLKSGFRDEIEEEIKAGD